VPAGTAVVLEPDHAPWGAPNNRTCISASVISTTLIALKPVQGLRQGLANVSISRRPFLEDAKLSPSTGDFASIPSTF
jgi:hypothetical protein